MIPGFFHNIYYATLLHRRPAPSTANFWPRGLKPYSPPGIHFRPDPSADASLLTHSLDHLLKIMVQLRDPEHGCPWDREQDFPTIAPYTIEEAYEVADAIARNDMAALKDELGDLLFQVVFHARMAEEHGLFTFEDVTAAIASKMERRHPHVFGDARIDSAAAQGEA